MTRADSIKKIPKPTAVLLDWDQTMIDPSETIVRAIDDTIAFMAKRGYPAPEGLDGKKYIVDPVIRSEIIGHMVQAYTKAYKSAGSEGFLELIEHYRASYGQFSAEHTKAMRGARELLAFLQERGIPHAIVTHKRQEVVEEEYQRFFGGLGNPPPIISAVPDKLGKPHPYLLYEAMDVLNIPPEQRKQVWMVGDSFHADVGAAKNAGCVPVWFGREAFQPVQPDVGSVPVGGSREASDPAQLDADIVRAAGHPILQKLIARTLDRQL